MPRVCTICEHPERGAIDRALVGGASNRSAASLYDVSEAAVRRHKGNHLPAKLVLAEKAAEVADADNLLDQVGDLQRRTMAVLQAAETSHEHRTALAAIREARGNLELLAKLIGQLDERPVVNLNVSPEWLELRTVIVGALQPYSEARESVLSAIESVGNGHTR
jgi:signal transduction histidine kinase